ncbi:MAG: TonB C-terminal domain-containing protein [Deltaproteobacteria bacterium]|nr:TonB C-terminal domain-containing protein [Deltaproteobacteria bacterium]
MSDKQIKKSSVASWGLLALMVVMAGAAVYFVKVVLSDDSPRKKSSVAIVTLLKPPPPPQIKEKPPEPEQVKEVQQKEEVFTPGLQDVVNQDSKPAGEQDNTPAGDNLGLDAEGTAGGDAFGLVGKKGGRSLLAGGGGSGGGGLGNLSLLTKFAGYAQIVETEIRKRVMKRLDEEGGVPRGKLQAVARVSVDSNGAIVDYRIIGSSGNHKMDDAVKQSLGNLKISAPPPDGMPRTMIIKITSLG